MAYLNQDVVAPEQGATAQAPARRAPAKSKPRATLVQEQGAATPAQAHDTPAEAASGEAADENIVRIEGNDDPELAAMTNEDVMQLMLDFGEKAAALTAKYNARLKELQTMQDEIERHVAQRLRKNRMPKSIKVPQPDGSTKTISLSINTKAMHTVSDRKAFFGWVRATGNFQIVQARVSTKEMDALAVRLKDLHLAGKITEDQTVVPGLSIYRKEVLATTVRTTQAG